MNKILRISFFAVLALGMMPQLAFSQEIGPGYSLLSRTFLAEAVQYEVEDAEGHRFTIITPDRATDFHIQITKTITEKLYTLVNLEIESFRIVFEDEQIFIQVNPASYLLRDNALNGGEVVDVAKYMVSGMQFYYLNQLEYNFRMLIDNLFVRINGFLFSPHEFEKKLLEAVDNPANYIQTHDPEYIIHKIAAIDNVLDELKQSDFYAAEADEALRSEIADLRNDIALLKEETHVLKKGLTELSEKHAILAEEFETQTANFNKLRYGLIMLQNRGFFGGIDDIDKNAITKLTALKTENPSLTVDEARKMLKEANMEMSKKEIFLVFAVYFNDFD